VFPQTVVQPQQKARFVALSAADQVDDDSDAPAPEDIMLASEDLEAQDDDGTEDDGEPPAWYTSQQRIDELRTEYKRHDTDTGSPEFQVAGMTERISYLTKHLKIHPKDFSTRRGLVALVNKRRRLLNYLFKEDPKRYYEVVSGLGIRHKAPSNVPDRVEKYGRFPSQKAIKKHLITK